MGIDTPRMQTSAPGGPIAACLHGRDLHLKWTCESVSSVP